MTTDTDKVSQIAPPAGARFYKCAFQVNPYDYAGNFRGQASGQNEPAHAKAIVDKAVALGIEVLAITDHNSVKSLAAFRAAAREVPVHIFPGFELSSSEGVHLLCIYPPETALERLERYLGQFGIHETTPTPDATEKTLSKVLKLVRDQGGISIAAHVTNKKGLFKTLQGQARIRAWRDENLLAAQIPGGIDDLPQDIRQIFENRNPDYRRAHPPGPRLALAAINAKDIVKSEDMENRSSTCWIKMDDVSIDGLRQAFLDPGSRVRLNSSDGDFQPEEHMELLSLGWEGGFLDGVKLRLNPNLNVLIGGRGAGKSTIIESIRNVLALDPIGKEAVKAHQGMVRHVLRSGTKITLRVRVQRPGVREYRIERTIPNPPLVLDASGEVLQLSPSDVLPKIEAYGQHEISELARSPDKLTRLLDRFVEQDDSLARRKKSLRRHLANNRRALCDARSETHSSEEQLAALPGLQETLKRFQEVGLEERLKEQSLLVREERVLDSVPGRLEPFNEALRLLRGELPIDQTFVSDKALSELPGKETLSKLNSVLSELNEEAGQAVEKLAKALKRTQEGAAKVRTSWDVRKQQVQAEYEKILRELQKSRVDGEEFIRLRRQVEGLRPIQGRLDTLRLLEKELMDKRRSLLAEWEDCKASEYRAFDRAARNVSKALRDRVEVKITSDGDREPLFGCLREEVGGRMSEAVEVLRRAPELSVAQFVEACRLGADSLRTTYGITSRQAERLADAGEDVFLKLEELELEPTTEIRLNTAPGSEAPMWKSLEDLSTGQKATAVLLLLLLESGAPLIVDQPEDDLDNRFITEGIVPRMREEKQRRQFIFATHNANIPVLGDAELILGLSAKGEADIGQARVAPEHAGSIDSQEVRELVEEILEGGREAFEKRRRKYGF